jgi:hypothetical protein
VSAEQGIFRPQEYQNPTSAVLLPLVAAGGGASGSGLEILGTPAESERLEVFAKLQGPADDKEKKDATRALLDNFKAKSMGGKVTGILPVNVSFPAFGPSIFLVSELTSENQFPTAEFNFQRDKKAGVR